MGVRICPKCHVEEATTDPLWENKRVWSPCTRCHDFVVRPVSKYSYWLAGLSIGAMLLVGWGFLIYLIVLIQRGQA